MQHQRCACNCYRCFLYHANSFLCCLLGHFDADQRRQPEVCSAGGVMRLQYLQHSQGVILYALLCGSLPFDTF
jgi:hypothetical protein